VRQASIRRDFVSFWTLGAVAGLAYWIAGRAMGTERS
jgi:hypothetical protein